MIAYRAEVNCTDESCDFSLNKSMYLVKEGSHSSQNLVDVLQGIIKV